jgi:hypothetical protein
MKKFVAWLFGIETWEAKARIWMDRAIVADMEIGRLTNGQAIQSILAAELEASLEAEKARSRELADLSLQRWKRIEELEAELHKERNIVLTGDALLKGLDEQVQAQEKVIREKKERIRELEASECDLTQERDGMRSELKDLRSDKLILTHRLKQADEALEAESQAHSVDVSCLHNALSAERARVVEMGKRFRRAAELGQFNAQIEGVKALQDEKDLLEGKIEALEAQLKLSLEGWNYQQNEYVNRLATKDADLARFRTLEQEWLKSREELVKSLDRGGAVIASLEDGLKQAQERIEAEQRCSADMNQWLARERDLAASYRNSVENYCQTNCDLERQHSDALAESDELRRRLEEIRTLSYLERA